jgi:uncharacterized protein YndB with AHSA1/START domain
MANNTIHVDAPPQSVYDVLCDPRQYANWVVGASTTRGFEGAWPEPGSLLHHTQMLVIRDTTQVLEVEPLRRLVLEARARPVVVSRVELSLHAESDGTRVVLEEYATGGLLAPLPRRLSDAVLHLRNMVCVRRLKCLAEIGRQLEGG